MAFLSLLRFQEVVRAIDVFGLPAEQRRLAGFLRSEMPKRINYSFVMTWSVLLGRELVFDQVQSSWSSSRFSFASHATLRGVNNPDAVIDLSPEQEEEWNAIASSPTLQV